MYRQEFEICISPRFFCYQIKTNIISWEYTSCLTQSLLFLFLNNKDWVTFQIIDGTFNWSYYLWLTDICWPIFPCLMHSMACIFSSLKKMMIYIWYEFSDGSDFKVLIPESVKKRVNKTRVSIFCLFDVFWKGQN